MSRRNAHRGALSALLGAMCLVVAACGGSSGIQSGNGVATVKLASSITGSSFLAVTAGIAQGIFAKHDIDLQVIKVKSTAEGTAALASGDAHIAAMLTEGVIAARTGGAELKIVASLLTQDQHILYATPGITSPADLAGKRFGVVGPGSGTEMLAKALAEKAGLVVDSVQYVPTGAASTQLTSLVSGQIDAAGLVPPYDTTAAAEGMVEVVDYRDVFPDMTPQVFATTAALIAAHTPELTRFVDAYRESAVWVQANPVEAIRVLQNDAQIPEQAAQAAYEFARPDYSTDGRVDPQGLEKWLELSKRYGTSGGTLPTVAELYDPSLLGGAQ